MTGTVPNSLDMPRTTASAVICADSGFLATKWCPNKETKVFKSDEIPEFYCPMHNLEPGKYPVAPGQKVDKNFDPNAPEEPEEPPEEPPVKPPVKPPVDPPVDPPVTPPVDPPVEPPVDPPDPVTSGAIGTAAYRVNIAWLWMYNSRWIFNKAA
jgi:hypothetical protein